MIKRVFTVLAGYLLMRDGFFILSQKEQDVLSSFQSYPTHRENSLKKQSLLHRSVPSVPTHDLRTPHPPRQVLLYVGEGVFAEPSPPMV